MTTVCAGEEAGRDLWEVVINVVTFGNVVLFSQFVDRYVSKVIDRGESSQEILACDWNTMGHAIRFIAGQEIPAIDQRTRAVAEIRQADLRER